MRYEKTKEGIFVPAADKAFFGGKWKSRIVHADGSATPWDEAPNIVVNEGLDHFLDVTLSAATQITSWFVGIFEANYTPVATDTAANIATNSTESTAYTEANRQAWTEAGVTAQNITNVASKAAFTINATKTMWGAFLVSSNVKSGTAGTLIAAGQFASSRAVVNTDVLEVTYELTAADA